MAGNKSPESQTGMTRPQGTSVPNGSNSKSAAKGSQRSGNPSASVPPTKVANGINQKSKASASPSGKGGHSSTAKK